MKKLAREEEGELLEGEASSELLLTSSEGSADEGRQPRGWRHGCAPPCVERLVQRQGFHLVVGLMILLNLVTIVVSTDYEHVVVPVGCNKCEDPLCFDLWMLCNRFFLCFFTVELMLRFWVEGVSGFFCDSSDRCWNWMDCGIVTSSFLCAASLQSAFHPRASCRKGDLSPGSKGSISQTVFLARMLRLLRLVRIFRRRSFPRLNMLARGLMESFPQVATVLALVLMLVFITGILTTTLIGQQAELWAEEPDGSAEDAEEIKKYFGQVAMSMFTLFQFMTLDDWVYVSELVAKQMPIIAVGLFYPFIVVVGFVMLSLFSGVWVDHMNDMRLKEEKETQLQAIHEAEKANKTFQTIFGESDDSPMAVTNTIDEDEFAVLLTQPQYKEAAAVSEMNFTRSEARELFALWDREQDERLSWSEFREGLEEYREGLTVKKILVMKSQLKKLVRSLESGGEGGRKFLPLLRASPGVEHQLEQADARLRACEERMLAFEDQVKVAQKLCAREASLCSPFSACSGGSP